MSAAGSAVPGTGPGWSLHDGVSQEALADTPGGRVPGPELCEMEDSGPEWLVEGAALRSLARPVQDMPPSASQSTFLRLSRREHTVRKTWADTRPTQGTLLLGGPRPGLLSRPHPTWPWRCPMGQSQAISGRDFGGLVLSVSSSDIAPQKGSLRGREGGGSGISEHQLCAVMPAGRPTSFRHLRPQLGALPGDVRAGSHSSPRGSPAGRSGVSMRHREDLLAQADWLWIQKPELHSGNRFVFEEEKALEPAKTLF